MPLFFGDGCIYPLCGIKSKFGLLVKAGQVSLDRRAKLSLDFNITLLEELSQCLFDYLALCM